MPILTQFGADATTQGNVFTSLGIDWQMLILQIVGFLLLVVILGRYVYPWLMKSVDERQAKIEAATQLAEDVKKEAAKAEEKTAALLEEARKEAADIVNTARLESNAALAASEEKAKKQATHIVAEAKEQIQKDVVSAKKALYDETLNLVASATEKVVGAKVDAKANEAIITKAIKSSASGEAN